MQWEQISDSRGQSVHCHCHCPSAKVAGRWNLLECSRVTSVHARFNAWLRVRNGNRKLPIKWAFSAVLAFGLLRTTEQALAMSWKPQIFNENKSQALTVKAQLQFKRTVTYKSFISDCLHDSCYRMKAKELLFCAYWLRNDSSIPGVILMRGFLTFF